MDISQAEMREMWDRLQITDALHCYSAALDERGPEYGERPRFAAFDAGFTPDAVFVDYYEPGSEISREEFIVLLTQNFSKTKGIHRGLSGQHLLTNIKITLDGDSAKSRCEYISIAVKSIEAQADYPGRALMVLRGGFYEDDYIRTVEGWRITRHKINRRWDTTAEAFWPLAPRAKRPVASST
ncbi:MAG TPA: nuclear transport factor 2 family protein [Devosia sp.]|nr:nuclear transport factor 2 family protein [Devosia sp.]